MNEQLEKLLLAHIQLQCRFVLWGEEDLHRALLTNDSQTVHRAFYVIQTILNAAGNISKTTWGSGSDKATKAEERKGIRDKLLLLESSPLRPTPDVRNAFEHFDDRVVEKYRDGIGMVADANIGPGDGLGAAPEHTLRNFNDRSGDVSFVDSKINLFEVFEEVRRLLTILNAMGEPSPTANQFRL